LIAVPLESERSRAGPRRAAQVWAIALVAGIVAGLLAWVGGELAQDTFKPRLYEVPNVFGAVSMQPTGASTNVAEYKNASLAFAILGGVTGLVMGLAGGVAGRSVGRGVIVGLGAQAVGALVGALASLVLLRFFYRGLVPDLNDLWLPVLIHGGIWMAIGAVGGFAFALGKGSARRLQAAIGAAVASGFFASILFQTLSARLLPDAESTGPMAGSASARLLAMLSVTVLIAIGAARGTQGHATRRAPLAPAQ
jgi:hypothetical protein